MSKKPLVISVCVPSYNRPESLRELIEAFLVQTYAYKELIITDDSSNEAVKKMLDQYSGYPEIRYYKNAQNIGFAHNLRKSLLLAKGDVTIMMGDDDIFLVSNALSQYVRVFSENPTVSYMYANQVQFASDGSVKAIVDEFTSSKKFGHGKKAIERLLVTSIFIGGLTFRNHPGIVAKYYPDEEYLHPQFLFSGNILMNHDGYGLAEHLIGFRSEADQFIYKAMKDKKIQKVGNHQNIELFTLFNILINQYKNKTINLDFLERRLVTNSAILYPKEKCILGNEQLLHNYRQFCLQSKVARNSLLLWFVVVFSFLAPPTLIQTLRNIAFFVNKELHRSRFLLFERHVSAMLLPSK